MEDDTPRRRGRPLGSKNRPKPTGVQRKRVADGSAEDQIHANLGGLVDVLIKSAVEDGDVSVAMYLINRLWGKPTERREAASAEQKIVVEIKDDWRS